MSGETIRAALAVFDDAALEALTNKGVVRRAAKDIESGKVAIAEAAEAAITVAADGETVHIDAQGPRGAKCSCPAPGICRHKIAAVLVLRGPAASEAAAEAGQATPPAQTDPLAEILALDSAAIAKWTGKANLRAAAELLADAPAPEFRRDGAALVIRVSPDEPEIRFLSGCGLDGMVSKAPASRVKSSHAAAILAVRRANGLTEAAAIAQVEFKTGPELPDPEFLAQVGRTLEDAVFTALNQAPLVLEERMFSLSISSRADALPRLGRLLRQLAAALRQKRERDFAFSPAAALSQLASAYALVHALQAPQADDRLTVLKGAVRQDYAPAGDLTLFGLGASLWYTQTGARGLTGYFYAAELGRILTATLARAADRDPNFDPKTAYDNEGLWGADPLSRLIRSKVLLGGASVSADGRLSFSGGSRASAEPWQGTRVACAAWPVLYSDWRVLEEALRAHFHERLAAPRLPSVPLLLAPAYHARTRFNVHAQEHRWGVADAEARWINLTLRHSEMAAVAAERLQRVSSAGALQFILVEARSAGAKFELTPISVVARMPYSGRIEFINLDLETHGTEQASPAMNAHWLAHLARRPEGGVPVRVALTPGIDGSAAPKLCGECSEVLLTMAELGVGHRSPEHTRRLDEVARRLETLGLLPLADACAGLAASRGKTANAFAGAFLRTAHVLERVQVQMRCLPRLECISAA